MELKALINGKEIIGENCSEFVRKCLQEISFMYKGFSAEERIKKYIEYFVNNFSYDVDHKDFVLSGEYHDTMDQQEKDLSNLFINKKGVCHQFAQALSLLSCFDKEIQINYCFCSLIDEYTEENVAHANNVVIINGDAKIVDISSMIHSRDKIYKQEILAFSLISFEEYIQNLRKEKMHYYPEDEKYRLGSIKYIKDFDTYHYLLNQPASVINENKWSYVICSIDYETINESEVQI